MFGTSASQPFVAATCRAATKRCGATQTYPMDASTQRAAPQGARSRPHACSNRRLRGPDPPPPVRVLVAAEASSGAANEGSRGIIVRTGAGPGRAARRRPEALALSGRPPGGRLARARTYFRGDGGREARVPVGLRGQVVRGERDDDGGRAGPFERLRESGRRPVRARAGVDADVEGPTMRSRSVACVGRVALDREDADGRRVGLFRAPDRRRATTAFARPRGPSRGPTTLSDVRRHQAHGLPQEGLHRRAQRRRARRDRGGIGRIA